MLVIALLEYKSRTAQFINLRGLRKIAGLHSNIEIIVRSREQSIARHKSTIKTLFAK